MMDDRGIKTRVWLCFNVLIVSFIGMALVAAYYVIDANLLNLAYQSHPGSGLIGISAILFIVSLFTIMALIGNFSVALNAKRINSAPWALIIGGLSGALTMFILAAILFIKMPDYLETSMLLIIALGFLFGTLGALTFVLFHEKYLGKAGILDDKRLLLTAIAIAVFFLIANVLEIILPLV